jgi:hypothetical protein
MYLGFNIFAYPKLWCFYPKHDFQDNNGTKGEGVIGRGSVRISQPTDRDMDNNNIYGEND